MGDGGRGTYGGDTGGWYARTGELERELSDLKKKGEDCGGGLGALSKNDAGIVLLRLLGFTM